MRNEWICYRTYQRLQAQPNYLSSVEFDTKKKKKLTSDINEAVAYADYIISFLPHFLSDS
jgi:glycerol-3-phosphate dehydrogenase (NAD(P)+)